MDRCGRATNGLLWLLCAGLIFFAMAANAQDDDEDFDEWGDDEDSAVYSAPMKYVSFGFLLGLEDFDRHIGDKNDDKKGFLRDVRNIEDEPLAGFQFKFGTRSMEYVAYEFEFDFVTNINFDADKKNGSHTFVNAQAYIATFNVKIFPFHDLTETILNGRLQPYVVGGAGGMAADGTSIDTPLGLVLRGGAGAEFYLTQNMAVHADATYVNPLQQVKGLNMWQFVAGISYHFD